MKTLHEFGQNSKQKTKPVYTLKCEDSMLHKHDGTIMETILVFKVLIKKTINEQRNFKNADSFIEVHCMEQNNTH